MTPAEAIDRIREILAQMDEREPDIFGHPIASPGPDTDAPVCKCGTLMLRRGRCYTCPNCLFSTGTCD